MSKTVFILGAGASKLAGVPLMAEFLDKARQLMGISNDDKNCFGRVFNAIIELRKAYFKSYIDLDNIESIFGAFEMGRLIGCLGDYSLEDIKELSSEVI